MIDRREDFALQRVPDGARRPLLDVTQVALAIPTALVFLATGGALWQTFGTGPLLVGIGLIVVTLGFAGYVLTRFACLSGLDSDLMSIWAGYGLRGSALSSLIYSGNFVVLFALEASIVASAVQARYDWVPRSAVVAGVCVLVVAFTWRGVSSMTRFMSYTLPLLMVLFAVAVVQSLDEAPAASFFTFHLGHSVNGVPGVLAVYAALLAFVVNATVGADLGRFLRREEQRRGALVVGVGLQIVCFIVVLLFGAWLTYRLRGQTDPGSYLVGISGTGGLVLVVMSQLRINAINAYAGSLSLSNFAARSVGFRPGRHVWMIVLVAIAGLLSLSDVYSDLVQALTFEAVFVAAWGATLVTYVLASSPARQLDAADREIDRLEDGRSSVVALLLALAVSVPFAFGAAGELAKALAPIVAIAVASFWVWVEASPPNVGPSQGVSQGDVDWTSPISKE